MNIEVYETNDYSKFKFIPENRITVKSHIAKLVGSIDKVNLLLDFPIIVDNDFNVLDGQNRLEACIIKKIPVYYKFAKLMNKSHISIINTVSKKWIMEDFMHQYVKLGNKNYILFKDFIDYSQCRTVSNALRLLSKSKFFNSDGSGVSGASQNKFITGEYEYPENDNFAKHKVYELNEISKYTHNKNPYCRSLLSVYDSMTSHDFYDFNRLINKLNQYPLAVYNNDQSLLDNINKAYNYKCNKGQPEYYFKIKRGKQNGTN